MKPLSYIKETRCLKVNESLFCILKWQFQNTSSDRIHFYTCPMKLCDENGLLLVECSELQISITLGVGVNKNL